MKVRGEVCLVVSSKYARNEGSNALVWPEVCLEWEIEGKGLETGKRGCLERACEGKVVSAGEKCLRHQEGGEKERIEDGLEERDQGRSTPCKLWEQSWQDKHVSAKAAQRRGGSEPPLSKERKAHRRKLRF